MREGELVETLRMRALPKGSDDYVALVGFLRRYRDAVQLIINSLWNLDEAPSIKALHKMFYDELRRYGFRHTTLSRYMSTLKPLLKPVGETVGGNQF
ncbi:MAG: hypothetical protein QW215_07495 [Ignisphaera sp.]